MTLIDTPLIFPFDSPRARKSDPLTSHAAADRSDISGSQREVLSLLSLYPAGLTDHEISEIHERSRRAAGHKPYTGSRLRTARSELVKELRVCAVGKGITPHGNPTTRWARMEWDS